MMQAILDQLRPVGVGEKRVLEALSIVPREVFLPESLQKKAYDDCGHTCLDRQLWRLSDCGLILQNLAVLETDRVLCLGAGLGYFPIVLEQLAAEVTVIDSDETVVRDLRALYATLGYETALVCASPYPEAWQGKYDVVVALGAVIDLPKAWLSMLSDTGRLFAILGEAPAQRASLIDQDKSQALFETSCPYLPGVERSTFQF